MAKKDKTTQKTQKKDRENSEVFFIPAGVIFGIGYGLLTGQVAAYTLIGLGTGFALTAIIGSLRKKK